MIISKKVESRLLHEIGSRLFVVLNFEKDPQKVIPRISQIVLAMVKEEIRLERDRVRRARLKAKRK